MGLIRRVADFLDPPSVALEKRATEVSWDALRGGVDVASGAFVNPRMAENLSTVLACVGAISSAMASLPAYVYRTLPRGREIDTGHPLAKLIGNGPNQHQSWPDFIEWFMASALLRGNAISEIKTDAGGAVVGLIPIPWEWVSAQLLPSGRLVYDIEMQSTYGGTGRPRRLLQHEVFHLRDRSDNGLLGVSRLQRAAAVVQAGLSMQTFATSMWQNSVNPSGALETAAKLTDDQRAELSKVFRESMSGPSKAGRTLLLDQGLSWKQISLSPEDAEFLASRRFTVEELCRLYGVPPPVAGDLTHGTFSNVESLLRWFAMATLTPWIKKLESEFTRSVFSAATRTSHKIELDLSGMLRGDPAARWSSWKIAVEAGILDPDEIREEEGWNRRAEAATPAIRPSSRSASSEVADILALSAYRVACFDASGEPCGSRPATAEERAKLREQPGPA